MQVNTSGMLWRIRKSTLERPNHCKKDKSTEPLVRPDVCRHFSVLHIENSQVKTHQQHAHSEHGTEIIHTRQSPRDAPMAVCTVSRTAAH